MTMLKRICAIITLVLLLTGCTLPAEPTAASTAPTTGTSDSLTVHFIDVGQADCALLECGGSYALIDGGNVDDSSLVVSYLQQAGVEELTAVFNTHPHEDHVGGLAGVLAVYPTQAVYAPTTTYSSDCYENFLYYADQQGLSVTIPSIGQTITLGDASIQVLGPTKSYADLNNISLILMVTFGDNRFLFTGDMEMEAEADLINSGAYIQADVLKVGHHGSYTSTSYRFLYEVQPKYAVISVGRDNPYGHPHDQPMSRLRDADCTIYRTDLMGSIVAVSDGTDITFSWGTGIQPENPEPTEVTYIGNVNSLKFHLPTCKNLPRPKNQIPFDSYEDAIAAGYTPCSACLG